MKLLRILLALALLEIGHGLNWIISRLLEPVSVRPVHAHPAYHPAAAILIGSIIGLGFCVLWFWWRVA